MPHSRLFAFTEARTKLGKSVHTTAPITNIPCGTRGIVTDITSSIDGYSLIVTWEGIAPRGTRWAQDWFSKNLYAELLTEEL